MSAVGYLNHIDDLARIISPGSTRNGDIVNNYLERTTGLPTISSHTVMLWCYVLGIPSTLAVMARFGGASSNISMYAEYDGSDLKFNLLTGGTGHAGSIISNGIWYHFAWTHAGTGAGNLLGYINGVLDITTDGISDASFGAAQHFRLLRGGNSQSVDGNIMGVKVFNRVLTAAEIKAEMPYIYPLNNLDCLSWNPLTPMKQPHADRWPDLSGQGNHLSLTGTLNFERNRPPIIYPQSYPKQHMWIDRTILPADQFMRAYKVGHYV